ncbi:MAG TPA: PilZ domain-containing protein [Vicinamibacterales bacterium]|jgi:hypothetical protein|nr:PilZ domain-containing protein [Vicinamibacterales bacterium]
MNTNPENSATGGSTITTVGTADRVGPVAEAPAARSLDVPEIDDRHRRQYDRVAGPFDGRRLGLLETVVRLYDISLGGCFVNSMHEEPEGTRLTLKIDLPREGWITVDAVTVYRRAGFGFAVRFTDMNAETSACLERAIRAIQNRQS